MGGNTNCIVFSNQFIVHHLSIHPLFHVSTTEPYGGAVRIEAIFSDLPRPSTLGAFLSPPPLFFAASASFDRAREASLAFAPDVTTRRNDPSVRDDDDVRRRDDLPRRVRSRRALARRPPRAPSAKPFAHLKLAAARPKRRAGVVVRAEAATEEKPASGAGGETYEYQAEVNRLLDLIVNSLYSNRDVFLRELVSNASDALDKLRFTSVSNPDVMADNGDMKMQIKGDPASKTLVIEDTGIGMTRDDLVSSLGTIARSGTANSWRCSSRNPRAITSSGSSASASTPPSSSPTRSPSSPRTTPTTRRGCGSPRSTPPPTPSEKPPTRTRPPLAAPRSSSPSRRAPRSSPRTRG